MVFAFILIILFIAMFIKLGMYSVWVTVLFGTLKIALIIMTGLFITIIWRKVFRRNER